MKRINIIGTLVICVFLVFNVTLTTTVVSNNSIILSDLLRINQASAEDLDEITITCDTGGFGRCYEEDCHWEWTPLGGWNTTYCPRFSGYQNDICVPEMPC